MRRASGQPRLSHGLTSKSGPRSFNLPTRRRSCCSTSPLSKVDLVELVSRALGSVTEGPVRDGVDSQRGVAATRGENGLEVRQVEAEVGGLDPPVDLED